VIDSVLYSFTVQLQLVRLFRILYHPLALGLGTVLGVG